MKLISWIKEHVSIWFQKTDEHHETEIPDKINHENIGNLVDDVKKNNIFGIIFMWRF
jgi:hypothetical protein